MTIDQVKDILSANLQTFGAPTTYDEYDFAKGYRQATADALRLIAELTPNSRPSIFLVIYTYSPQKREMRLYDITAADELQAHIDAYTKANPKATVTTIKRL